MGLIEICHRGPASARFKTATIRSTEKRFFFTLDRKQTLPRCS